MPKIPEKPKPVCKACGGTGVNSRGGPCNPCLNNAAKTKLRALDDPTLGERFLDFNVQDKKERR